MSYILDALHRAEQERQRKSGAVPGLQTRTIPAPLEIRDKKQPMVRRWTSIGLGLTSLTIVVALMVSGTLPEVAPTTKDKPEVSAPLPAQAPAITTQPVTTPSFQRSAPPAKAQAQAQAQDQAKALTIAPVRAVSTTAAAPVASTASTASAITTPPAVALPFLKDLPEDFRRQVPPLAISGVVYSENPAQRLLLLNGQVLTQGSRVAADLTLDEIQPMASNFTYRGTRFKLNH